MCLRFSSVYGEEVSLEVKGARADVGKIIKKRRRTSEDGSGKHRSGNAIARNIAMDLQGREGPRSGRGTKAQKGNS